MQGIIRTNIDARLYNKGARHTRYLQAETKDDKYEAGTKQDEHQAKAKGEVKNEGIGVKNHVDEDIQVMGVHKADRSPGRALGVLKKVEERDKGYQKLKENEEAGKKPKDQDMVPYAAVWEDQAKVKGNVKNEGSGIKNHNFLQAETKSIGIKDYEKQNDFCQAETKGIGVKNHNFLQAENKGSGVKDNKKQNDSIQAEIKGIVVKNKEKQTEILQVILQADTTPSSLCTRLRNTMALRLVKEIIFSMYVNLF